MFPCVNETAMLASSMNIFTNSASAAYSGRICFTTRVFSKPAMPYSLALKISAIPPMASFSYRKNFPNVVGLNMPAGARFYTRAIRAGWHGMRTGSGPRLGWDDVNGDGLDRDLDLGAGDEPQLLHGGARDGGE